MITDTRPRLKYRIVHGMNPINGGMTYRPMVADRKTASAEVIVKSAIERGYVIGNAFQLEHVLNGFARTMRELVAEGVTVNFGDWMRIYGEFGGSVGANEKPSEKNEFKIIANPFKKAKLTAKDFRLEEVG